MRVPISDPASSHLVTPSPGSFPHHEEAHGLGVVNKIWGVGDINSTTLEPSTTSYLNLVRINFILYTFTPPSAPLLLLQPYMDNGVVSVTFSFGLSIILYFGSVSSCANCAPTKSLHHHCVQTTLCHAACPPPPHPSHSCNFSSAMPCHHRMRCHRGSGRKLPSRPLIHAMASRIMDLSLNLVGACGPGSSQPLRSLVHAPS